jgi:hypothetical protein
MTRDAALTALRLFPGVPEITFNLPVPKADTLEHV